MMFKRVVTHAGLVIGLACSSVAHADDWGCEVLLCLSNPAGPTAVGECVSPIKKLWRHLAKGRSFPKCSMGGSGNHDAKHEWATAENCPPGYLAKDAHENVYCLMRGVITVQANGVNQSRTWWSNSDVVPEEGAESAPSAGAAQDLSKALR